MKLSRKRKDLESELRHKRMWGRLALDGNKKEIIEELKTATLKFENENDARRLIELLTNLQEDLEFIQSEYLGDEKLFNDIALLSSVRYQLEGI